MTTASTSGAVQTPTRKPIKNLRIRFWGVQGSCPLFPESHEVDEYRWLVAKDAIGRVVADLQRKARGGAISVDQLLGGPNTAAALDAYQRELGVTDLPVYGGETTCVSIETADGHVILLDGGSGIRNGSKHLIRNWGDRPRTLNIFASHEHLDHRCGLPFCQFCFVRPAFHMNIYGTRQVLGALDSRYGLFSREITSQMHYDDPIDYRVMSATFQGIEICPRGDPCATGKGDGQAGGAAVGNPAGAGPTGGSRPWWVHDVGQSVRIGETTLTPFDVYHGPTRCVAYKVRHGPVTFVFCTDHELRHGTDPSDARQAASLEAEARLVEQVRGADLAYFDGQYFLDEYAGRKGIGMTAAVPRIDWGHGCIEDIISRCRSCGVKHALIGHHDPERSWQERLDVDQRLARESTANGCRIELAKSEMVVDL